MIPPGWIPTSSMTGRRACPPGSRPSSNRPSTSSGRTGRCFPGRSGFLSSLPFSSRSWRDSRGFSLAAMFGLVGQDWIDHRLMILALGLGPAVLGGMIVAHLIGLGVRRWLRRRRLSRLVYAVTDHRAIVARVEARRAGSAILLAPARRGRRHAQLREPGRLGRPLFPGNRLRRLAALRISRGAPRRVSSSPWSARR